MKLFTIIAWISGITAVALMIMGVIALILGTNPFGVRREANYYLAATPFLLLGILCLLARQSCKEKGL